MAYRKYPEIVKDEIARTGSINLFPDLKIPRTTAQYWVRKQKQTCRFPEQDVDSLYKRKSEHLQKELEKERSLRQLVETVRRVFPFSFQARHVKSKSIRTEIVAAIQRGMRFHSLARCLQAIGLTKSSYQRWSSEVNFCKRTKSLCSRRPHSQLTDEEMAEMKRFVTEKKYAHIPISSLHLLAQRMGKLFCSIDTWYKYVRRFEWQRPWRMEKKIIRKTGVRAKRPNEIWHIDVTVVNVRPGYKLYIQVVIDNFSRFVLAWRVTETIGAFETVETLKMAKQNVFQILGKPTSSNVFMDPGLENNNGEVLRFISSSNLIRTLARVEVHYSNSMIESLFRLLKNNYLYHQGIRTIQDLERKVAYYLSQHNEVIPQALHGGGTPREVFRQSWGEEERSRLKESRGVALIERRKSNLAPSCGVCPV